MSATSTYMTFLMHKRTIEEIEKEISIIQEKINSAQMNEEKTGLEAEKTILENKKSNMKDGYEWIKLVDITEFPDIGTDPEILETTTLSDNMQTFVIGIHGNENMTFNANYDHNTYIKLKDLEGKTKCYSVGFGGAEDSSTSNIIPNGKDGKFTFDGQLSLRVTGGGVNGVRGMSISIAPSSVIHSE